MKNRCFGVFRRERSEKAPKNAVKRILAVFLSVCLAASSFAVPVYAVPALIPILGEFIKEVFMGCVMGTSALAILNSNQNLSDTERQQTLNSISEASTSNLVEFYAHDDQKMIYVQPASGLSGEQLEMAEFIADSIQRDLNRPFGAGLSWGHHIYSSITNSTGLPETPGSTALKSSSYSFLKTSATNAINGYVAREAFKDQLERTDMTASELEAALGTSFPRYDFDFVGPIPHLEYITPTSTGRISLITDGFSFTPNVPFIYGQTGLTSSQAEILASYDSHLSVYSYGSTNYIRTSCELSPLYAFNYYFLSDDGHLFFSTITSYNSNGNYAFNCPLSVSAFYDSSGKYISDRTQVNEILSHITSFGCCLNIGNQLQSSIPVNVVGTLTDEDFTTTTGGEAVSKEIPRTSAENIVGAAIGLGLISDDPPLTIGADGTITKADDIPIEKLDQIIEAIKSGTYDFSSVEDYLSLISTLVGNGNLTETEQKRILDNINTSLGVLDGISADVGTSAKDLTEIKDILKTWAAAAEAEAAAENLDFDLPDVTIIDKFPFSLPFDVYYVLGLLCTSPKEPVFDIPIKTKIEVGGLSQKIDEQITIDLTALRMNGVDMVRVFVNTVVTISFVFCLISATRKFIWK